MTLDTCLARGVGEFVADSGECWQDDDAQKCACPCVYEDWKIDYSPSGHLLTRA